jgi:nitroimidazol reductase NimA-like FMN-containing flavoprotein (pyridoxamine 5'-phosphate oxidase superfamily)
MAERTEDRAPGLRADPPTERARVRRLPERGVYERSEIDAILDEALICHLAYVRDGEPRVIPTIHARVGDTLYVHGSNASRTLRSTKGGAPVAAEVTLLDGLVLARSAFHHSMNYRSVVVYGRAREVTDPTEKFDAQRALVEHVVRGRAADARLPNQRELDQTTILAISLDEASAKVRTGPPKDEEEDSPCRMGRRAPLRTVPGEPDAAADGIAPRLRDDCRR